jgi:hypothetical protein
MGEQPKPVEDEVERALASMRAGFLSGSERIAAHIASLYEHLVDAPSEERETVRAHVARLVASHDRITARVVSAPASSWDSFKVMVSAVKQQQTVLDEVSHLVKEHVLPRQLESLPITPFPAAAPTEEEPPPPPPPRPDDLSLPHRPFPADDGLRPDAGFRAGGGSGRASDIFRAGDNLRAGAGVRADMGSAPGDGLHPEALSASHSRPGARRRPQPASRSRSEAGLRALSAAGLPARGEAGLDEPEGRSLLAVVRERTAGFRGLAAMLVVGIILSLLPRERLQEVGTRLFELIGPAGSETAMDDRPPYPPPPVMPRSAERVPPAVDEDAPSPASMKVKASAPTAPKETAADSMEEAPVAAPPQGAPKLAAAAKIDAEPVAPPSAPAPATEERFVPVVFTHKDHATVLRTLSDLKKRYPNVLTGLEGEIQSLDLGKKGIWHRLVFLPPGPRPQATKVCDRLAANGYDRCSVKAY